MEMREFIAFLEGVVTVFDHNGIETVFERIFNSFYEFKEKVKATYSIEFNDVEAFYEDGEGMWGKIINEQTYFEGLKWADGIRFYIRVDFDDNKIIKKPEPKIPEPPTNKSLEKPWNCSRCQSKNDPSAVACKICKLPKRVHP